MGRSPTVAPDPDLAVAKRKEAEQEKKLEQERIDQERARFGGGGSLLAPDQKKNQQSQLGG